MFWLDTHNPTQNGGHSPSSSQQMPKLQYFHEPLKQYIETLMKALHGVSGLLAQGGHHLPF